jgi:hypothetical protein
MRITNSMEIWSHMQQHIYCCIITQSLGIYSIALTADESFYDPYNVLIYRKSSANNISSTDPQIVGHMVNIDLNATFARQCIASSINHISMLPHYVSQNIKKYGIVRLNDYTIDAAIAIVNVSQNR